MSEVIKSVCQLDSQGHYLGQVYADPDPMEKGHWLIPAYCIDQPQPESKTGLTPKWDGKGWQYVPNHFGKKAYRTADGQPVVIEAIGNLPADLTLDEPPSHLHKWMDGKWALDAAGQKALLALAKDAKLAEVNAASERFINEKTKANCVPLFELLSWEGQKQEAKRWVENPAAETPLLQDIAAARGIELDKLRAAALRKSMYAEKVVGIAIGTRQALEKKIELAKTVAEVEKILVVFTEVSP